MLVSKDMAEKMQRGGVVHIQSEDGKKYHARHARQLEPAERQAIMSQPRELVPCQTITYQAVDEAMDVEDDSSPAGVSSARSGRGVGGVQRRRSPVLLRPSEVDAVAAASAASERERMLLERERILALREHEWRQHILQYERDYDRVYEARQNHFAAHPYYHRYSERPHPQIAHWDPRVDQPRAERHPIVYTTRPPRSITPREPPRSSSR